MRRGRGRRHGLVYIEDSRESLGSVYQAIGAHASDPSNDVSRLIDYATALRIQRMVEDFMGVRMWWAIWPVLYWTG